MQFKLNISGEESILSLNGELTLLHAEQFKDELMQALSASRRVVVDTRELSEIDLACLQLFCSAHLSALAGGKELVLGSPQSDAFRRQVTQSGLICGHLCGKNDNTDCLWNGGDQ